MSKVIGYVLWNLLLYLWQEAFVDWFSTALILLIPQKASKFDYVTNSCLRLYFMEFVKLRITSYKL